MKVSQEKFYVYIDTNKTKSVLYIGVTNDLPQRLVEHFRNERKPNSFAGTYRCHFINLLRRVQVHYRCYSQRTRIEKLAPGQKAQIDRIDESELATLNAELFDQWPLKGMFHRKDL